MTKPPSQITLSAEAGAALIVRVHQSGLSVEDAGVVEQVSRRYYWVVLALLEAKLSVKRLRTLVFGKGAPAPPPRVPAATASAPEGTGEGAGEWQAMEEAASATEPGAAGTEVTCKPPGGHRPGPGRLGAEAYAGAERVECRHEA